MARLFSFTATLLLIAGGVSFRLAQAAVLPNLVPHLVNHYDFEHPLAIGIEDDLGLDHTPITLSNGAPRVFDPAWGGGNLVLETRQNSNTLSNDDWKAGVFFDSSAESTLTGTNHVAGITVMGWFKPLGSEDNNPSPNTNTSFPFDRYNAFGLFGLLRGDENLPNTDGHAVRALLEVINGRVTALGRRLDDQSGSASVQSEQEWYEVLVPGEWTHLAGTFDFDQGNIRLYRNGLPLETEERDLENWQTSDLVDYTSETNSGGIKIGGSYPDNSEERNPFNGRLDELMIFNRTLADSEVLAQYNLVSGQTGDFTGDGSVDGADFFLWQRTVNEQVTPAGSDADGDGDASVTLADLEFWRQYYGYNFPPVSAENRTIPEPAGYTLFLWAQFLKLAIKRRNKKASPRLAGAGFQ